MKAIQEAGVTDFTFMSQKLQFICRDNDQRCDPIEILIHQRHQARTDIRLRLRLRLRPAWPVRPPCLRHEDCLRTYGILRHQFNRPIRIPIIVISQRHTGRKSTCKHASVLCNNTRFYCKKYIVLHYTGRRTGMLCFGCLNARAYKNNW